jgi:putative transcriptional regulator
MTDHKEHIVNSIRRLRFDNKEMTQEQLAERVSVTRQTIIALEAGKYAPSLLLAMKIARVFGKQIEEVFTLEGDKHHDKLKYHA